MNPDRSTSGEFGTRDDQEPADDRTTRFRQTWTGENAGGRHGRGIKQGAREAAGFVREKARTAAETRKSRVADRISHLAEALDAAADCLGRNRAGRLDEYSRTAARRLYRVSDGLQRRDLGDLAYDLSEFGRRNPLPFVGGAFLAGVMLGRFLRSTSPENGLGRGEFGEWGSDELSGPETDFSQEAGAYETGETPGAFGTRREGRERWTS